MPHRAVRGIKAITPHRARTATVAPFCTKNAVFVCVALIFAFFCVNGAAAQSTFITEATEKGDARDAVVYLTDTIPSIKNKTEQKQVYVFLAHLQQQLGAYMDAYDSFSRAIALDTGAPNTDLRLEAALCALGAGEVSIAEAVLDSVLKINSTDTAAARAKLYAVWCGILKAESTADLATPIGHLTNFSSDSSMNAVKPAVLFSLWWLTGDESYAAQLRKNYAGTPEASVVAGLASVLPMPYLFFVPRIGQGFVPKDPEAEAAESSAAAKTATVADGANGGEPDKVKWQQVGLFRDEANAERCVTRLKEAGFAPEVIKQSKASGNTYSAVVVRETDGTVAEKLRNAGFECYPVYE